MVISSTDRNLLSEACIEKLRSLLPHDIADDEKSRQWWDCVFFRQDGGYVYDKEYDSLHVSDKSNITFGQLLSQVVMLNLSSGTEIRLKGENQEEILVPLTEETLSSIAYDSTTWSDVLPDKNADFFINGIGIKKVRI